MFIKLLNKDSVENTLNQGHLLVFEKIRTNSLGDAFKLLDIWVFIE